MTLGPRDEHDPAGRLGPRVRRAGTDRIVYLESDDIVDLLERVDDYIGEGVWEILTIDRTVNATFYAFLALTQGL